ncbi:MAG: hypothetical protein WA317_01500 [Mycobacterium sp.]|uniref:hypothetical protein n=1 Tax=Mycobacterium sp. TaxID=1785 RepID=UPI003CC69D7E
MKQLTPDQLLAERGGELIMSSPKSRTFIATFLSATRKGTSRKGNPTWSLVTSAGVYLTESDGSIGYSISNYTGRSSDRLVDQDVEFTVTKNDRVTDMRPV